MLRPKLPDTPPVPTAHLITSAPPAEQQHSPVACSGHTGPALAPSRPLTPYVGVGVAVVVVGVVLTALLATVAVTAVSVSIAVLVLRSLLGGAHSR